MREINSTTVVLKWVCFTSSWLAFKLCGLGPMLCCPPTCVSSCTMPMSSSTVVLAMCLGAMVSCTARIRRLISRSISSCNTQHTLTHSQQRHTFGWTLKTFSNSVFCMKILVFSLKFHWNVFISLMLAPWVVSMVIDHLITQISRNRVGFRWRNDGH